MDYSDHPTCKTCKHWVQVDHWDMAPGFARCIIAPMASEMIEWSDDLEGSVLLPEFTETLLCAMDGSSYFAAVYTRSEFYCPMHSALKKVVRDQAMKEETK